MSPSEAMSAPSATRAVPSPAARRARERLKWTQGLAIETCGRIAQFWGFTRSMGRTFGLLYVVAEPLPQAKIQQRLRISAGNASMTLAALLRWGVVQKVAVPGARADHYLSETDFWKMISGVLNERERREIRTAIETMTRAEAGAREALQAFTAGTTLRAHADHTAERLARLREICELGETMLDMLLGQLSLDVARFRDVLKV
jgi:DNA-binding transcriptional regulator GbsR (MarR family)